MGRPPLGTGPASGLRPGGEITGPESRERL